MTRRDLAMRFAGVATIGAAWGSCLWLRSSMLGPAHDPTLLEFALAQGRHAVSGTAEPLGSSVDRSVGG